MSQKENAIKSKIRQYYVWSGLFKSNLVEITGLTFT